MDAMNQIESATKTYADKRAVLSERVQALEADYAAARRRHLRGIKQSVAATNDARDRLAATLEEHSDQFAKRRTRVLHGVKVGFQKAKGKVSWSSVGQVLQLIRKHLPDRAPDLIRTKEEPVKEAIAKLPTADLRRIGCSVTETGDELVIRPTDSSTDKLVNALLKEGEDDGQERAA